MLACLQHCPVIFHGQVFAFFAFQEVVNIGDRGRDLENNEHVGAEPKNPLGYVSVDADRKSTRLNSSHVKISYAVFCLKKKNHTAPPAPAARTWRARRSNRLSPPSFQSAF